MKILLTNDDGIDAPGLQALHEVAIHLGEPIVVAPREHLSGCSHRVTTDGPIHVEQRLASRFSVAGTPADCVRIALHRLAPDVDWILSGINAGGNLGTDVHHSGTVAAAREAVLHGKPGIAVSQYSKRGQPIDWERASAWVTPIVRNLMAREWMPGTFWNINLPHLDSESADPEIVFCPLEPAPLPLSFREVGDALHYNGDYHGRVRAPGTDVDVCFSGKIAVTKLVLIGAV